ncbi:MAG: FAD:protein FMN transferase [Sphingomonas fennica]
MGTGWSVRATTHRPPAEVEAAVIAACDAVIAEMSGWIEGSELARFNRAPAGTWQALSPGFFHVLATGIALAAETGGAFDPGAGALVDLWGFGPAGPRPRPDPAAVAAARTAGDARRIALDRAARRACQPGGVALDLSGIAKGHAVDRVAGALAALGIRHMLVEIGGELRGIGVQPDGQPWWVAVELPPGLALPPVTIGLTGLAVATSGDYRRAGADGLSHTIDPRSGRPIANGIASATILHGEAMMADALATAVTVLGVDQGLALADAHGAAAMLVVREGGGAHVHTNERWRAMAA